MLSTINLKDLEFMVSAILIAYLFGLLAVSVSVMANDGLKSKTNDNHRIIPVWSVELDIYIGGLHPLIDHSCLPLGIDV